MRKYCLVIFTLCGMATSAQAVEYLCPERMKVETQTASAVDGFESLNIDTTQSTHDAHFIEGVSLYSGHPRDRAELVPDNENDVDSTSSVWTTNADEYHWMACQYTQTSLMYIKKIHTNTSSCKTIRSRKKTQDTLGLTCK